MRTLHFGLRVADLERSLTFCTAVGYEVVGSVSESAFGHLTMLKLPDDDFVTVELVHDPTRGEVALGTGLSHFVIKVESSDATITDPDGNRIELVQWPAGHADGMNAEDWAG
jgi:lactoylglutathione lyase